MERTIDVAGVVGRKEQPLVKEIKSESLVKRMLYGAWDGTKKVVESQSPEAWSKRIMQVVDERIVPKLSSELQEKADNNRAQIEHFALAAGVGITTVEIVAAVAGIYAGKKVIDKLKTFVASWSVPDSVNPAMRQRDCMQLRPKSYKSHRRNHQRIPVELSAMKVPDPRDHETLREFAGAIDRMYPDMPIVLRRPNGELLVMKFRNNLWKKKAIGALGEVMQQMPDISPKYLDIPNKTLKFIMSQSWYNPSGATKAYKFRFDESAVRERFAFSMLRAWAEERGITDPSLVRALLLYWKATNLVGIPRTDPKETAQFISRYVKQEYLSDYARTHMYSSSLNSKVSRSAFSKLRRIIRPDDPVPLSEAHFALPVQHAMQRLRRVTHDETGKDIYKKIQLKDAISAMWIHKDDKVISRHLAELAQVRSESDQASILKKIIIRLGSFLYTDVDASFLWRNNKPRQAASAIVQYWQLKKFKGLSDIMSGIRP